MHNKVKIIQRKLEKIKGIYKGGNHMKKGVKIGIGIFIAIILVALIFLYFQNKENYNNRNTMQTTIQNGRLNEPFTQNQEIDLEDLTVKLSDLSYYPEGNEESIEKNNVLEATVEFESKNQKNINSVIYDYLIFDEDNNILNTSLWENLVYTKNYITGFLKEKYQENQYYKFNDYCVFNTQSEYQNNTEDLTRVSKTMVSSLDKELTEPEQITVRIINLRYQFEQEEYKELKNTDLEFVVNFE